MVSTHCYNFTSMLGDPLGLPWGSRSSPGPAPLLEAGNLFLTLVPWERGRDHLGMDGEGRSMRVWAHSWACLHLTRSPTTACPNRLLACMSAEHTPFLHHLQPCDNREKKKKRLALPCIKQHGLILIVIC